MFTVLLSTIGSGVICGMRGIHPGIGVTGRVGGTYTVVGHMIGTGVTAMLGIIITIGALSVPDALSTPVIMTCIPVYPEESTQRLIRIVRSLNVITV